MSYTYKKSAITKRKEGITYKTGVASDDVTQLFPKILSDSKNEKIENVGGDYNIVIFDLETTTARIFENDEICQIAAYYDNDLVFNTYILPGKPVSKKAFLVTGLQVIDGALYLHDKRVKALSAKTAVIMFLNYLKDLKSSIILIAYNGFRFDVARIIDLVMHCGLMDEFKQYVKGFADSLVLIRNLLPERRKQKKKFSVGALDIDYLENESLDCLHNAVDDVKILKKIFEKVGITSEIIFDNVKTFNSISIESEHKLMEAENKNSLQDFKEILSANMISKTAKNGISKCILEEAFKKSGDQGVILILSDNKDRKPLITKNKKILETICKILAINSS